jgi:hypothetical protein
LDPPLDARRRVAHACGLVAAERERRISFLAGGSDGGLLLILDRLVERGARARFSSAPARGFLYPNLLSDRDARAVDRGADLGLLGFDGARAWFDCSCACAPAAWAWASLCATICALWAMASCATATCSSAARRVMNALSSARPGDPEKSAIGTVAGLPSSTLTSGGCPGSADLSGGASEVAGGPTSRGAADAWCVSSGCG